MNLNPVAARWEKSSMKNLWRALARMGSESLSSVAADLHH